MGEIVYAETRSKIVADKPTGFLYQPKKTTLDDYREFNFDRRERKARIKEHNQKLSYLNEVAMDPAFFLDLPTAYKKSTPSVMKFNKLRDKRLNEKVNDCLKISTPFRVQRIGPHGHGIPNFVPYFRRAPYPVQRLQDLDRGSRPVLLSPCLPRTCSKKMFTVQSLRSLLTLQKQRPEALNYSDKLITLKNLKIS